MRGSAPDGFVARWWRGEAGVAGAVASALALPASAAYAAAMTLRNAAFDSGVLSTHRARIPVISVGNITVGGTGKTPFAGWVVEQLLASGLKPALVSRGYGADEPSLHRRWNPGSLVVTDPDRRAGVAEATSQGADIAVLDDGFQHRRIGRDLDIVLLAERQGVRIRLLPRGPFREGLRALRRADLVVLTHMGAPARTMDHMANALAAVRPDLPRVQLRFAPDAWRTLDDLEADPPDGKDLLGVTSVADPAPFGPMVNALTGAAVKVRVFPDHHDYSEADVRAIAEEAAGRPIVTTEKDSVKLVRFANALPDARVLGLRLDWEAGEDIVRQRIASLCEAHG